MRVHLLYSKEALTEGEDHVALCSSPIEKARWIFQGGDADRIEHWPNICKHCRENFSPLKGVHVYLYGAINGRDYKRPEAE